MAVDALMAVLQAGLAGAAAGFSPTNSPSPWAPGGGCPDEEEGAVWRGGRGGGARRAWGPGADTDDSEASPRGTRTPPEDEEEDLEEEDLEEEGDVMEEEDDVMEEVDDELISGADDSSATLSPSPGKALGEGARGAWGKRRADEDDAALAASGRVGGRGGSMLSSPGGFGT
eukprot:820432-Prorocentrum_minimum.AAC.1